MCMCMFGWVHAPQEMIHDIERNGYCFTDGNGQISPLMLQSTLNALRTRLRPFEAEGDVSAIQVSTCMRELPLQQRHACLSLVQAAAVIDTSLLLKQQLS